MIKTTQRISAAFILNDNTTRRAIAARRASDYK
jgi:hypothetical protein